MESLIAAYVAKPGLTSDERRRCRAFWDEFVQITSLGSLDELTHGIVEGYERKILDHRG